MNQEEPKPVPNRLPPTPDPLAAIRLRRTHAEAIDMVINNQIEVEELTDAEFKTYTQVLDLSMSIAQQRVYNREEVKKRHTEKHLISSSTAERHFVILNKIKANVRKTENDIRRSHFVEKLYKKLDNFDRNEDNGAYVKLAAVIKELENFDKVAEQNAVADAKAIQQHVYIINVDLFGQKILQKQIGDATAETFDPHTLNFNLTPKDIEDAEIVEGE